MDNTHIYKKNENGFVLVTSLLILLVLTMIGIIAIQNSTTELQVSGNDRSHKETFYQADGGTEVAAVLTFENALCINAGGFTAGGVPNETDIGLIRTTNLFFAEPGQGTDALPSDPAGAVLAVRDAAFYTTLGDDTQPHTNFTSFGTTTPNPGSGAAFGLGYGSMGTGTPGGGTHLRYTTIAQRMGNRNSQSTVELQWKLSGFLINNASSFDCKY